jgi:hypothetical protein
MITTSPTLVLGEYQNDTRVLPGYQFMYQTLNIFKYYIY